MRILLVEFFELKLKYNIIKERNRIKMNCKKIILSGICFWLIEILFKVVVILFKLKVLFGDILRFYCYVNDLILKVVVRWRKFGENYFIEFKGCFIIIFDGVL